MERKPAMGALTEDRPFISIVLPTYNRARELSQAVKSVINQEYKNWELLVVDNNSVDDTDLIINNFNDERIRLFKIENEGSIGKSRNLGIEMSKGEWIAFLDSDDSWLPNKLTVTLPSCSKNVDFIYHDLKIAFGNKTSYFKKIKGWKLNAPVARDLLMRGNPIANSSVVVRRKIFEKVGKINEDMDINPAVDYHTWLKIAIVTNSFVYIPDSLGIYRIHNGNLSLRDMSISHGKAISEFLHLLSSRELILISKKNTFRHARYKFLNKQFDEITPLLFRCMSMDDKVMTIKIVYMILIRFLFWFGKSVSTNPLKKIW